MNTINNGLLPRVSLAFVRYTIAHVIIFLRNVIAMMTDNDAFPLPLPTLVVFSAAVDDLDTKTQAAMNGGRTELTARRASLVTTLTLARQLALYVEAHSNNDLGTLQSSGFEAIKAPTPPVIPNTPGNPRLGYEKGLSGLLIFRFTGNRKTKNYSVQLAESADGPWTDRPLSTKTRVPLPDLTPGKTYWARSKANGSAGSSDWTVPTSKMVI